MNWPQLSLASLPLITIARVNWYEAESRKWVQGAQIQSLKGLDGKWAAVRLMLITFHQEETAGICWRRLRNSPPGTSIPQVCMSLLAQRSKMKQELTEAPQQMPTNTHTRIMYAHKQAHIFAWMCPPSAIWPFLLLLHALAVSTESRADVPTVTCQGEQSYLELFRCGDLPCCFQLSLSILDLHCKYTLPISGLCI